MGKKKEKGKRFCTKATSSKGSDKRRGKRKVEPVEKPRFCNRGGKAKTRRSGYVPMWSLGRWTPSQKTCTGSREEAMQNGKICPAQAQSRRE